MMPSERDAVGRYQTAIAALTEAAEPITDKHSYAIVREVIFKYKQKIKAIQDKQKTGA